MRNDKENIIVKLTFEFSLDIMDFAEELESKRKFVFANQILKAGTSLLLVQMLVKHKVKQILFIR